MPQSIEWVIPGEPPVIVCLLPKYSGKPLVDIMQLWSLPSDTIMYNWQNLLSPNTIIQPGMRLHAVLPLVLDTKKQRHRKAQSTLAKKHSTKI